MNPSNVDDALRGHLQEWLGLRLSDGYSYLKWPRSVTHRVRRGEMPKYGEVSLNATPAPTFAFKSLVQWPEPANWDGLVLQGVLDVLMTFDFRPVLGVEIVFTAFGWHDVESVPIAYYWAAKEATAKLLEPAGDGRNIDYRIAV